MEMNKIDKIDYCMGKLSRLSAEKKSELLTVLTKEKSERLAKERNELFTKLAEIRRNSGNMSGAEVSKKMREIDTRLAEIHRSEVLAQMLVEIRKYPSRMHAIISNELGSIGEKVVADWLLLNDHPFIHFGYHHWVGPVFCSADDWGETKFLTSEEGERLNSLFDELRRIRYRRPDFLARMPELTFLEVKVNKFEMPRKEKAFLALAKKHGFEARMACVKVEVSPVSLRNLT